MRIEQRQYPRDFVHRRPAHLDLAETSVIQPLGTIRLEPNPPAPERPLRNTQNLRRLRLAQIATTAPPVTPSNFIRRNPWNCSVRRITAPSSSGSKPTDHLFPTPDISRVSDSVAIRRLTTCAGLLHCTGSGFAPSTRFLLFARPGSVPPPRTKAFAKLCVAQTIRTDLLKSSPSVSDLRGQFGVANRR